MALSAQRQEQLAPDFRKKQLALWNIAVGEQLDLGRGRIPQKRYLFTHGIIPRGELQRRKARQVWRKKGIFKNITAEAQRAQRINFLFVGRRRQTKTLLKLEL